MLGNLLCTQQEFNRAKVTLGNNEEQVIRFEEQPGGSLKALYDFGAFTRQLKGNDLQEVMFKLLLKVYPCVHDCKPVA